jgi:hypothetical protein
LESIFDAPKQPHIPHFTAFTLADLESTDSESSYSSDESDTGHEFSTKTLDNTGDVQKKKKKVSFSDKVTLIPDYIYKEEESNEKRSSVQNIMTNFNNNIKMNAKKREKHKPIKQTPQSPQRLSNKLLGFFQQKRIFTSEKPPLSNPKNHTDTTPEPLTHVSDDRR